MRFRYMLIGLAALLLAGMASAELYRYTDERGVIHFTDNFIEIPESQRPKVEIINRSQETAEPQIQTVPARSGETPAAGQAADGGRPGDGPSIQSPEAAGGEVQPQPQFDALIKTKADLDKIFEGLAAEKQALEQEQKTLKTVESIRAFQEKVNRFNQRLADYERQRQSFQAQADLYNRTVVK